MGDFGCHFLRSVGMAARGGFGVGAGSVSGVVTEGSGGGISEGVGGASISSDGAGAFGCHFLRSGIASVGATSAADVSGTAVVGMVAVD